MLYWICKNGGDILDIKQFFDKRFGSIRVVIEDGSEWFVGADIAKCLGYKNPRQTLTDHVKEKYKTRIDSIRVNGTSPILISESGVFQLIMSSKLSQAEAFQDWIFEEVLPSIRNTGGYLDINRSEVRAMTKESRTTLTEVFFNLTSSCYWITSEQSNQYMRILSELANKLSGIGNGGRDKANTEQLMKLSLIENSFTKTLSKKMRKFKQDNEKFSFKELIYKCEVKAEKALINAGFKADKVYITTNW